MLLEEYAKHFDGLFGKSNEREGFRRYVEGLVTAERADKTLTGLTNTEPMVGAQLAERSGCSGFSRKSDLVGASGGKPSDSGCCERMRLPRRRRKGCW